MRFATYRSASGSTAEGTRGAEHIGLDHLPHVSTCTADWVAATFAARS